MNDIVTLLSSLDPALLGTVLAVAVSGLAVLIGLTDGIQTHRKRIREMEARHAAERERLKAQVERWVNDERARYEPEKPKRGDVYYLEEEDASWMD